MLPAHIVGIVETAKGKQPFVLDTPTGDVAVGSRREADPQQARMSAGERRAAVERVKDQVPGATRVTLDP